MNKAHLFVLCSLLGINHYVPCTSRDIPPVLDDSKIDTKDQVIDKAMKEIKQSIDQTRGLFTICCTYKIFDGQPILTTKRFYYSDYRKKSDLFEFDVPQNFARKNPDEVIEVIYKRPQRKKFLSLVHKHPLKKNRRLGAEKITIPTNYFVV